MANPVIEALMEHRVSSLVDPPKSWGKAEKAAFLRLPRDLQIFYANREKQRDTEVRRAQNERADTARQLAEVLEKLEQAERQLAKYKENESNGQQSAAA